MSESLWEALYFVICLTCFCVGFIAGDYHGSYSQKQIEEEENDKKKG